MLPQAPRAGVPAREDGRPTGPRLLTWRNGAIKLRELPGRWSLTKLKVAAPLLDMEFQPSDQERDAAWAMYVELLTGITTQALPAGQDDEAAAPASVHSLFGVTRAILRAPGARHATRSPGSRSSSSTRRMRPFTAHWHKASPAGAFDDPAPCLRLRAELAELAEPRDVPTRYAGVPSEPAEVEDLTRVETADRRRRGGGPRCASSACRCDGVVRPIIHPCPSRTRP